MCKTDFSRKLKNYGMLNFKNEEEMARALKLTMEELEQCLSGEREPDFETLILLAKTGCDMNWIMKEKKDFSLN